jgi:hypothetical protein
LLDRRLAPTVAGGVLALPILGVVGGWVVYLLTT